MKQEFLHEQRWQLNQIGFHGKEINRHLQQYWPALNITPGSRVFLPLCGKSNDLLWLLAQGYCLLSIIPSSKCRGHRSVYRHRKYRHFTAVGAILSY